MDAASPAIFPPRGVLVAFATKHRSAGEIARTIAAGLAEADLEVDVLPAEQVERIDDYQAVVGSGKYINHWLRPLSGASDPDDALLSFA
jgi:menaquinone-dependent protoporphyrinogen IX oxidase